MPKTLMHIISSAAILSCGLALASSGAQAQKAGSRQTTAPRQSMEQCVNGVLTRLVRAKASEDQVGPAVISRCDQPLRASLAEAIQTGEAALCTVESCIDTARQRAAEEATAAYRAYRAR